jgi:hypothetical protein
MNSTITINRELLSKIKLHCVTNNIGIQKWTENILSNAIKNNLGISNKLTLPKVNSFEEELNKLSNYNSTTSKSTVEIVDENGYIREHKISTDVLE